MEDYTEQVQKMLCIEKTLFFSTKATEVFLLIMYQYITNHIHQYLELLLQMLIHWHVCSLALFSWVRMYFWLHLTAEMPVCTNVDAIIIVEPYASDRINLFIIVNGRYQSRVGDHMKHVRLNAMVIWSRSELIHTYMHFFNPSNSRNGYLILTLKTLN